jgi:hypothetical protein
MHRCLAVAALSLALAACGGGGGGNSLDGLSSPGPIELPAPVVQPTQPGQGGQPAEPAPIDPATTVNNDVQRVNSTTAGSQFQASVARLADGGFLVAWADPGDPSATQWCSQRYSAGAVRTGGEACIGSADVVQTPVVAGLADGGYAVAWVSGDSDGLGIWVLQHRADSTVTDVAHVANTLVAGDQNEVAIAALAGGGYVVTWHSGSDIYARRFDADGVAAGPEQRVDTSGSRRLPAVAGLADGGYVIASMTQLDIAGPTNEVYMDRFSADGTATGAETRVSEDSVNSANPAIAGLGGGGFVVTWLTSGSDGTQVVAQQFTSDGAPAGSQTTVRPVTLPPSTCFTPTPTPCPAETLFEVSVGALDDGGYVIGWSSEVRTADAASGIYARRFGADGTAAGTATIVSPTPARRPGVSGTGAGGFVVTWDAFDAVSDSDVFAKHGDSSALVGAGP